MIETRVKVEERTLREIRTTGELTERIFVLWRFKKPKKKPSEYDLGVIIDIKYNVNTKKKLQQINIFVESEKAKEAGREKENSYEK